MKVEKLIEQLKLMPLNSDVFCLWDGALRSEINFVYLSKSEITVLSDFDEPCYNEEESPKTFHKTRLSEHYHTPNILNV